MSTSKIMNNGGWEFKPENLEEYRKNIVNKYKTEEKPTPKPVPEPKIIINKNDYYTLQNLVKLIGCSESTLRTYICRFELNRYVVKYNNQYFVKKKDFPMIKKIFNFTYKRKNKIDY